MSPKEVVQVANKLFGDNIYQRQLFYYYVRTVQNCENQSINPRYYVGNLIGAPGFGKSGLVYSMQEPISKWIGQPFKVITRTLAGLNDLGDAIGVVSVDKDKRETSINPPRDFPKEGDESLGILFFDDYNKTKSIKCVNPGLNRK